MIDGHCQKLGSVSPVKTCTHLEWPVAGLVGLCGGKRNNCVSKYPVNDRTAKVNMLRKHSVNEHNGKCRRYKVQPPYPGIRVVKEVESKGGCGKL